MADRILDVYVNGIHVGTLSQPEPSRYIFVYDSEVQPLNAIALAMPVRLEPYEDTELFPIFAQQLPEPGSALFSIIGTAFSKLVSLTTQFDWLKLIGPHLQNRVTVTVQGQKPFSEVPSTSRFHDLNINQDSQELFEEMFHRVGLSGAGVSGMLPKLAVALKGVTLDARLTLGFNEEIIVKFAPDENEYPGLLVNEYLCMNSIGIAGVPVPEMRLSDDGKILGIKRFDRTGTSKPLGFEEAATVRFLSHTDKYSGSYEAMVRELLDFISPKYQRDARFNLYKIIAHTLLTGNGDAHQKNFGVLYGDPAHVQLAPAYDLVSTLPYISKDLPAVTFNGRKRWLQRREILAFGEEICGLTNKDAAEQLEILASSVEKQRAQIPVFIDRYPQFKAPLEKLSDVFARQLKKCLN